MPYRPKEPLVLIVEDSATVALDLAMRFEARGFTVLEADSLDKARAWLASGREILLAVIDLNLPDAPHGEAVAAVRESGVPVIVYTALDDWDTRERVWPLGVIDYVLKGRYAAAQVVELAERLCKNQHLCALVVAGSPLMRGLLAAELRRLFFRVEEAGDVGGALEIATREDLALVITGYDLPVMDGAALTRMIRERRPAGDLAIIGVAGAEARDLSARFLKSGADDFLRQPFTAEEFTCRVHQNVDAVERQRRLAEMHALKNRFLGMAAHDLRNPIGGVRGLASLLLDGDLGPLNEEQEDTIRIIEAAAAQMQALVHDLLDVSVIESDQLRLALARDDLAGLVAERVRLAGIAAKPKDIRLACDCPQLPPFVFDRARLAQVIDNLLANAVKFSPPHSTVNVSAKAEAGMVVVLVEDEGPGVDEADRERIFLPFQRSRGKPTGGEISTGLGLAITRRLVEAHGGRIIAEGREGPGARFRVELPLSDEAVGLDA